MLVVSDYVCACDGVLGHLHEDVTVIDGVLVVFVDVNARSVEFVGFVVAVEFDAAVDV